VETPPPAQMRLVGGRARIRSPLAARLEEASMLPHAARVAERWAELGVALCSFLRPPPSERVEFTLLRERPRSVVTPWSPCRMPTLPSARDCRT